MSQTAAGELVFRWQTGTFNQKHEKWVVSAGAPRKVPAQLWKKCIALTSPLDVRCWARQFGPLRGGSGEGETVQEWLRFAELGRRIANAAQALTSGGHSDPADWEALREWVRPPGRRSCAENCHRSKADCYGQYTGMAPAVRFGILSPGGLRVYWKCMCVQGPCWK